MSATDVQHAVREARQGDADEVVRLLADIYDEGSWFVGDGPPSTAALGRRIRSERADGTLFLVAVDDGRVIGWLELQRLQPSKLRHVAVLTLAVAPDRRREGIASGLLRRAYEWSRSVGVEKISLNVRAGNDAAISLYEREGFVPEGREERHIRVSGGYEANVIMARFLRDTDGRTST